MDAQKIRLTADGNWPEIFTGLFRLPPQILDGREHPCPKCGGNTRFRIIDEHPGALFCSHCFNRKNGDGLSAVQWWFGCTLPEAIGKVADYLGVVDGPAANGSAATTAPKKSAKGKGSRAKKPAAKPDVKPDTRTRSPKFADLPWNDSIAATWTTRKPPITVDALKSINATLTEHYGHAAIALPILSPSLTEVGRVLIARRPEGLPVYPNAEQRKNGANTEFVQKKIVKGGNADRDNWPGLIGQVGKLSDPSCTIIIKTEGPTDLLALLSTPDIDQFPHVAIVTNPSGAGQRNYPPAVLEATRGKQLYIVHDCDEPGQEGAICQSEAFHPYAATVRNVQIPAPPDASPKYDLRDWIASGATLADVLALAEATPEFQPIEKEPAPEVTTEGEPDGDNTPTDIKEADDDPRRLARICLDDYARGRQSAGRIAYWLDEWYSYNGSQVTPGYKQFTEYAMRCRITQSIDSEFDRLSRDKLETAEDPGKTPPRKQVTRNLLNNVVDAIKSLTYIPGDETPPFWIGATADSPPFPAENTVLFRNSIVHLPSLFTADDLSTCTHPPTPDYFSVNAMRYDFDAYAECPQWLAFLNQIWPNDPESIQLLQEWFGYCLTPNTSQQKLMMMIGASRSGKGTIARILASMLGDRNVTHPTFSTLAGQFGLDSFQNKLLAIFGDARLSAKIDQALALERLLGISGCDPQFIERKYKEAISVKLPTRLMIVSNEIPRFMESSEALINRLLMLETKVSFAGREDWDLAEKLETELPGIFNWAVEGWGVLQSRGRFKQPESSAAILAETRELTNPLIQFVNEHCTVDNSESCYVVKQELYQAYRTYCKDSGINVTWDIANFCKKLRATYPNIESARPRYANSRSRVFVGISLATAAI